MSFPAPELDDWRIQEMVAVASSARAIFVVADAATAIATAIAVLRTGFFMDGS
jgi:hypothetical protein